MENNRSNYSIERRLKTVMNSSTDCDINCNIDRQPNSERYHSAHTSRIEELGRNVDALIQEILCEEETDSPYIAKNSINNKEYQSNYLENESSKVDVVCHTKNIIKSDANLILKCKSLEEVSLAETKSKPELLKVTCNNGTFKRKGDLIVDRKNMTATTMIAVNNINLQDPKLNQILVRDCDTIFEKDVDLELSKNLVANLNELMEKNSVQFISADDSYTFIISLNSSIDTEQLSNILDVVDDDKNIMQNISSDSNISPIKQSKDELVKEIDIASAQVSKIYTCDICKKIFNKKDNYKSHLGIHDVSLSNHRCAICKQQFSWKSTLNKHFRMYHTPFVQTTYKCNMCDKVYKANWLLQNHIKRDHEKKYEFHCNVEGCNKSFFKKFDLTYHRRLHFGEKPYECGLCKCRFSHASHRTRHQRAGNCSSSNTSLVCPLCKHVFRRSAALATHMLHCKRDAVYGQYSSLRKKDVQQMCNEAKELLSDIDEVIKDT